MKPSRGHQNCIVSVDRSLFGPWFYSLWSYGAQLSSKGGYIHNVSVPVAGLSIVPFIVCGQWNVKPPLSGTGVFPDVIS